MEVMEDAIDATKVGNIYLCFVFSGLRVQLTPILEPTRFNIQKSYYIVKEFCVIC